MKILVTGAAGFIGSHLCKALCESGHEVCGVDCFSGDETMTRARLRFLGFDFESFLSADKFFHTSQIFPNLEMVYSSLDCFLEYCEHEEYDCYPYDCIVHLAAFTGVRASHEHPLDCVENNVLSFVNLLEFCKKHPTTSLVYASSSSVYGDGVLHTSSSETDCTDKPASVYAATKKANELLAYTYSSAYKIPTIGLRFFTVYGPYGRPDMAPMLFASAIEKGETIYLFDGGKMTRDFTYIDDVVRGIMCALYQNNNPPNAVTAIYGEKSRTDELHKVYNIGTSSPIQVSTFLACLQEQLGKKTNIQNLPRPQTDVYNTWADTSLAFLDLGFFSSVPQIEGIKKFAEWFKYCKK